MDLEYLAGHRLFRRELIPDPRGIVGFALIAGVLVSHLTLAASGRTYLWSENAFLEVLGHLWFLLGPPLGVFLGVRSLVVARDSLLPLVSVPLGLFLTVLTGISLACVLVVG